MKISEWSPEDQPREKLMVKGVEAMSTAELLAIILRTGTRSATALELSMQILHDVKYNLIDLSQLSIADFKKKYHGVGNTKAVTIIAALELGKRRYNSAADRKSPLSTSRAVFDFVYPLIGDLQHEEFWALYLDNSNKVIAKKRISVGGVSQTVADIRIIMKDAISILATKIILCHNHPSGTLRPSEADNVITKRVAESARLMDIHVIDHIIVGHKEYFSYADEGKI